MADTVKVKKLKADIRAVKKEIAKLKKYLLGECDDFKHDMGISVDNLMLNNCTHLQLKYDKEFNEIISMCARDFRKYGTDFKKLRNKLIRLEGKLLAETGKKKK